MEARREDRQSRLARWIAMQEDMLKFLGELEARVPEMDRLDLIVYSRIIFQHLEKTLKAFDEWLQDPLIAMAAPRDELAKVLAETIKAAKILLRLDIEHTGAMRELIEEKASELPISLLIGRLGGERRGSLSM